MFKKVCAAFLPVILAFLFIQACAKKSSPTTPPNTTPIATIEVDNFEDDNYVNSIQPIDLANNLWYGFHDVSSSANTVGMSGAPGGEYGMYCFAITSTVVTTIQAPGGYFGFNGMMTKTYTNFATSTGLDLSTYSFFALAMNVSVTALPTNNASFRYGLELYNGDTNYIQYDLTGAVEYNKWKNYAAPLSGFTVPYLETYTTASVLSNVTEIDIYYLVVGTTPTATGSLEAQVDNLHFDKY